MKRSDVLHEITNLKGADAHDWVVDTYNSINPRPRGYKLQSKDPWCAATVSAVLHKCGYDDLAECSCPVMTQKALDKDIWVEDDSYIPKAGDIIMYDWHDNGQGDNEGNPDHVGIVVKVDGDTITVREGNKNGTVGNRQIKANGRYIRGYIVPPYEADTGTLEHDTLNNTPVSKNPVKVPTYETNKTYTVTVKSTLNVRKGAGTQYGLVGYYGLTPDAKRHAIGSALKNGTRVTCLGTKTVGNDIWMKIPSGWICAKTANAIYVK